MTKMEDRGIENAEGDAAGQQLPTLKPGPVRGGRRGTIGRRDGGLARELGKVFAALGCDNPQRAFIALGIHSTRR